jgi:hypothetical protein
LIVETTTLPDSSAGRSFKKKAEGLKTRRGHLEDGQFRDGAEAVLKGPQHPVAVVFFSLEQEDDIDHVFERFRAGQGSLLGDMPDEERGDIVLLGEPEDPVGRLPHLADRSWARRELGRENGLDGIQDEDPRPDLLGLGDDPFQVGLGQ